MTRRFKGTVFSVNGISPTIGENVFIAPGAIVAGDVVLGDNASVWFNAVIRGDVAPIRVGAGTNVQDNAVLHVDHGQPCIVGDNVTIGHGAIVHGTTIADGVTVGMGSVVLSRSTVGEKAVIAAGAVVAEGAVVAPGALMVGIPAIEKRILDPERQEKMASNAAGYVRNAANFLATLEEIETESTDGD
jgi:carbonic anhydrase/acetyltransferase-like protein (isoleucine patch superfamily)